MPSVQLIEEIVRKVLAESGLNNQMSVQQSQVSTGPRYLILAEQDRVDKKKLARLLPTAACPVFMEHKDQVTAQDIVDAAYERIILPRLCLKEMADLALGRTAGRIPGLVLSLLMQGQKIEVLAFDYYEFKDTAPPALFQLYRGYEETLAGFGLCRFQSGCGHSRTIHDRLVTERVVTELSAIGVTEIITGPGCLVTALAADMARENSIRIITGSVAGKRKA